MVTFAEGDVVVNIFKKTQDTCFEIRGIDMSLMIHIYYTGKNGSAREFAHEMVCSGIVERIRSQAGNLRYEYVFPMDESEILILMDEWVNQEALNSHHKSPMMEEIAVLRKKYRLKMRVKRYWSE